MELLKGFWFVAPADGGSMTICLQRRLLFCLFSLAFFSFLPLVACFPRQWRCSTGVGIAKESAAQPIRTLVAFSAQPIKSRAPLGPPGLASGYSPTTIVNPPVPPPPPQPQANEEKRKGRERERGCGCGWVCPKFFTNKTKSA